LKPELEKETTQFGLDYRLMTQFTSFVAVEEQVVTKDGKPQRVEVPVEMPEGVTYEGVFGDNEKRWLGAPGASLTMYAQLGMSRATANRVGQGAGIGSGSGGGVGVGGGIGGGVYNGQAVPLPPASQAILVTDAGAGATSVPGSEKPTGERVLLESKLHPALLATFDCWKKSGQDCRLMGNHHSACRPAVLSQSTVWIVPQGVRWKRESGCRYAGRGSFLGVQMVHYFTGSNFWTLRPQSVSATKILPLESTAKVWPWVNSPIW
jgi:hypothetical protein